GKDILVGGLTYHVIGVLKDTRNEYMYMYGDFNGTVYVPYKNAMRMNNTGVITSIDVYIQDGYQDAVVEQTLRNTLDKMFNKAKKAYTVTNMASVRRMEENTNRLLSGMTGGIASIALLVGGIGIMNMMLVSVTERTKEIGLRKALGAEPKRIQAQFLIESIVLSVIGGTIGIILGLVIAFAATKLIQVDFDLSVSAILIGFGFATAVGVIFGWAPARRASRLNPIDALRTE
ncbi:MAG: FtsX-like permease family protein, partial [Lachnospiraceae bacterium]|nr:FtsX-like permease family protein [Lachnospiraceae bacterium]